MPNEKGDGLRLRLREDDMRGGRDCELRMKNEKLRIVGVCIMWFK
jgi:hypothetical protein